jgi:F1F0 ATPase subunit 2
MFDTIIISSPLELLLAAIAGGLLGSFYFSSLWITVQQLPVTQWPIRLMVGSLIGRLAIAMLGFYLIMSDHWDRAILGILGFVLARNILIHYWQPQKSIKLSEME